MTVRLNSLEVTAAAEELFNAGVTSFAILALSPVDALTYQNILGMDGYDVRATGPSVENDPLRETPLYSVIVMRRGEKQNV